MLVVGCTGLNLELYELLFVDVVYMSILDLSMLLYGLGYTSCLYKVHSYFHCVVYLMFSLVLVLAGPTGIVRRRMPYVGFTPSLELKGCGLGGGATLVPRCQATMLQTWDNILLQYYGATDFHAPSTCMEAHASPSKPTSIDYLSNFSLVKFIPSLHFLKQIHISWASSLIILSQFHQ